MYVCFCCVTNKSSGSLSPKFDVCTMSDNEGYNPTSEVCPKSTIRSLKTDVQSPQSKVWCTKSDEIWSLMSDVCPKTVWIMSKIWSPTYVCSKPGVQNPYLKPKSEVCQLSKSETEVQRLTPKIWSWKSEVESLSEVRSKFFSIIITLSYNTDIIYCVFVDKLWQ